MLIAFYFVFVYKQINDDDEMMIFYRPDAIYDAQPTVSEHLLQ